MEDDRWISEKKPLISVIVPVYKVEPYLRKCLDSIVAQTYRNLEILLIDDGSPDRCGEICDEYAEKDKRIQVFHTDNLGLSAARNLGIEHAIGEYIGFVDSDDWIEPNMYEMLQAAIEDCDISICGFDRDDRVSHIKPGIYDSSESVAALLHEDINNNVWNKLYRLQVLHDIRFPEGHNFEDIATMHRILFQSHSTVVVLNILYHYHSRKESIGQTYTACNLLDYADAYMKRYVWLENNNLGSTEDVLRCAATGISKIWRWWYGCTHEEKQKNMEFVEKLALFTKRHIPFLGCKSWPIWLRVSTMFMHGGNTSMAILYWMNRIHRRLCPNKSYNMYG